LEQLFNEILVPHAVLKEFQTNNRELPSSFRIIQLDSSQIAQANRISLHDGENEAIYLANELKIPVLTDDKKARAFCEKLEIKKIGCFGILRVGYERCLIERQDLEELLEKIKNFLFYEDWLIEYVLTAVKNENLS